MHQQLSIALGIVVVDISLFKRTDMHADEPYLSAPNDAVPVLQVGASLAQRFHFRPFEDDTGLETIDDKVIVKGFSVGGNNFFFFLDVLSVHLWQLHNGCKINEFENEMQYKHFGGLRFLAAQHTLNCMHLQEERLIQ